MEVLFKPPQDFSLDEAPPLAVRSGCVAVSEWWVEAVVRLRLHLQPVGGTWRQLVLQSYRVLSVRVTASPLPSRLSVLTGGEHLSKIIHRNQSYVPVCFQICLTNLHKINLICIAISIQELQLKLLYIKKKKSYASRASDRKDRKYIKTVTED